MIVRSRDKHRKLKNISKQILVQFIYPIVYNNVYIPRSSFSNPQNIIISTNTEYISETEMCIIINKTHIY